MLHYRKTEKYNDIIWYDDASLFLYIFYGIERYRYREREIYLEIILFKDFSRNFS